MKVDKPRRESEARGVDLFFGSAARRQRLYCDDGAVAHGDVGVVSGATCAVYNSGPLDQEVELHTPCLCRHTGVNRTKRGH